MDVRFKLLKGLFKMAVGVTGLRRSGPDPESQGFTSICQSAGTSE